MLTAVSFRIIYPSFSQFQKASNTSFPNDSESFNKTDHHTLTSLMPTTISVWVKPELNHVGWPSRMQNHYGNKRANNHSDLIKLPSLLKSQHRRFFPPHLDYFWFKLCTSWYKFERNCWRFPVIYFSPPWHSFAFGARTLISESISPVAQY
jgi:hypothetical protein